MLSLEKLRLNCESTTAIITDFIQTQVDGAGLNKAIVAVSGGIDSALTLALSARALGSDRVRAVTMPERDITDDRDITDVMELTRLFDVTCDTVEITGIIDSLKNSLPLYDPNDKISSINIVPRVRMIVSYHYANMLKGMVMGCSNKTELLTGYFTKYGDGGVDLMPIADLYKCQVRQLAEYLKVPDNILRKAPSAGLWPGQTDEGELGIDYDTLDLIIYGRELKMVPSAIAEELDIAQSTVEGFFRRVDANEHKRRMPLVLRLRNTLGI